MAESAIGKVPTPASAASRVAAERDNVRRSGVTFSNGDLLSYEVVVGMAVHDGDAILDTAEEVAQAPAGRRLGKRGAQALLGRRDISPAEDRWRWSGGIIPSVIAPVFSRSAPQNIQTAIDHWNSNPVVKLVPRTAEPDYVRFRTWWTQAIAVRLLEERMEQGTLASLDLQELPACGG